MATIYSECQKLDPALLQQETISHKMFSRLSPSPVVKTAADQTIQMASIFDAKKVTKMTVPVLKLELKLSSYCHR